MTARRASHGGRGDSAIAPFRPSRGVVVGLLALALVAAGCGRRDQVSPGPRLLGATGSNEVDSKLYRVDPTTGAAALIGPVTVGATGVPILGLAMHPVSHLLYAVTSGNRSLPGRLLRVDPSTGAATDIGALGISIDHCSAIAGAVDNIVFRADGTLFGLGQCGPGPGGHLYTISLETGAATLVGAAKPNSPRMVGFAASFLPLTSNPQRLFACLEPSDQSVYVIDPANGGIVETVRLKGGDSDAIYTVTTDPAGLLLLGIKTEQGSPATARLVAIDPTTGKITVRGVLPENMDALTLDLTSLRKPPRP